MQFRKNKLYEKKVLCLNMIISQSLLFIWTLLIVDLMRLRDNCFLKFYVLSDTGLKILNIEYMNLKG